MITVGKATAKAGRQPANRKKQTSQAKQRAKPRKAQRRGVVRPIRQWFRSAPRAVRRLEQVPSAPQRASTESASTAPVA